MTHFICSHGHKHLIEKAAKPRRKVTRTYTRVENLSKQMARAVQVNLITGIKKFKKKVNPDKLFEAWKTGSYGHIMETIPWYDLPADIEKVHDPLKQSSFKSSLISLEALPPPVKKGLRYDINNPAIKNFLNKRTGNLVTDITNDTQKVIQQSVQRSFTQALRPDQVGRMIKGNIGLLPRHAIAVDNYRIQLEKNGMAPDQVDTLTGKYQDRLLNYRANMIARTETRFATNHGQLSIWREAANQDLIDRSTAKKVWVTDGAPCEICDPMDGIAIPIDSLWVLNNGDQVEIPTESHPHCMCGMELDFGFGAVDTDEEE